MILTRHPSLRALPLAVLACAALAAPAAASTAMCNVPITAGDGTVLRANIWLPAPATGRVPTVLTVSGYNKDATNPLGTSCSGSGGLASADTSLADAGYAVMLVDDRGTGASQGKWDSWGERTQLDYRDVLDWIQAQPWSDGSVAATGASYMGITSFLVAEADAARVRAGKPRAVKAIWADVPMSDAYRDVTFHGGSIDAGFIPLWLGLTTGLSGLPPSTTPADPQGSLPTWLDHLRNGYDFAGQKVVNTATAGDDAYDGPFYRLRSPGARAAQIRVPVVITGGWWDIFQRGEPLLYEQLVNAPVKKLFMSPHYHTSAGPAGEDPGLKRKWFDRWLKGVDNGVEDTPAVNLYTMGANAWQHFPTWPVPGTRYTRTYLAPGKALAPAAPAAPGADKTPMAPVSSPCSRMTTQWTAGAAAGPCETDNRTYEATSLTYTSAPLASDLQVTGPIVANVWAETTAKDATLTAVLSEVDASGASNQITAGFLLASQRKVDAKRSTYGPGHVMIRPFHPFTRASQRPVTPNDPALYRIEIYPTSNQFKKGDSLRLTIGTANTPTTQTPLPDLANELGGELRVLFGGRYASNVLLPVVG
ncbi:MAG: hydrolase, CocE/NonD family [Solirubrobacterales bacterium]|nr:hydrolase, CocE/NonD family [Solirubrobacterales bacterium]